MQDFSFTFCRLRLTGQVKYIRVRSWNIFTDFEDPGRKIARERSLYRSVEGTRTSGEERSGCSVQAIRKEGYSGGLRPRQLPRIHSKGSRAPRYHRQVGAQIEKKEGEVSPTRPSGSDNRCRDRKLHRQLQAAIETFSAAKGEKSELEEELMHLTEALERVRHSGSQITA